MKISVAICTFNGERFLREQADSILGQQLPVDEIVVCDDGSADGTLDILEDYSKRYPGLFSIHRNEVNLRSVKNFEKAIGLCTGDVIFLSDQDDIWAPDKTAEYIAFFSAHPEVDVLASNGHCIDDHSKVVPKYSRWDIPHFLHEKGAAFDYHQLITCIGNVATGATMAIRRRIIPWVTPFPIAQDFHHDEWIAMTASKKGSFELLEKKYLYYRIHGSQQVGGVFFDKTERKRRRMTALYNLNDYKVTFGIYKKRLKKFNESRAKLERINAHSNSGMLSEALTDLEMISERTRQEMRRRHPVRSVLHDIIKKRL